MNKQTEALKLALEALEEIESYYGYDRSVGAMASSMYEASNLAKITSTRIREALAEHTEQHLKMVEQPAQEPVAYSYTSRITGAQGVSHHPMPRFIDSESWDIKPLYTSPPASKPWVGLTDEDLAGCDDEELKQARYWEAKLREKNT